MRIEITGRHLEVTSPIREYAESKCQKLLRFFNGVQEIDVVLSQEPHNREFEAEIRVDVPKHDDFVAKSRGNNIYECIDATVSKVSRQLTEFKERLRDNKR